MEREIREILFKGMKKSDKGWIEGYYAELGKGDDREHYIIQNNSLAGLFEKEEYNKTFSDHPVIPETVGQYTGLNDDTTWEELSESEKARFLCEWNREEERRNKKEDWKGRRIFENDIVKTIYSYTESSICKVVLSDGMFIGELADGGEDSIIAAEKVYVIGNVFDNPELFRR